MVAIEDESYERVEGNFVKLKLPNVYGNMWIIDGQHRLYGTAFSDSSKPVAICAIQGLDGIYKPSNLQQSTQTNQGVKGFDLGQG